MSGSRLAPARLVGALLVACAPEVAVIEAPLSPGDLVIVVSAPSSSADARAAALIADARGAASITLPPDGELAWAVLPLGSAVDEAGAPRSWEGVSVDLGGVADGCGCSAPALDLPQSVRAGDRCALPRSTPIRGARGALDPQAEAEIRARLRLSWPGACACTRPAIAAASRVEVCPLGEGAQRMFPDRLAVTDDDTYVAITRGLVAHLLPDGSRREHAFEPALGTTVDVEVLPSGDAVVLAQTHTRRGRLADLRLIPRGGSGAPIALEGISSDATMDGIAWDPARALLWGFGRLGSDAGRRPMLARCTFDERARRVECRDEHIPIDAACVQHRGREGVVGMVQLGGGDALALTYDAAPIVLEGASDRVVCLPQAERLSIMADGAPITDVRVQRLAVTGRRVAACIAHVISPTAYVAILTAEIGPIDAAQPRPVRWSQVAYGEGRSVGCQAPFADPARPGRLFQPMVWDGSSTIVELSATSSAVVMHPSPQALFGGLSGELIVQFAGGVGHLGALTARGDLLDLDGGVATPRLTTAGLGGARDRAVRAVAPRGAGSFAVDLGGAQPLVVESRAREGCADTRLVVPEGAYDLSAVEIDAVASLGARTLRAQHDASGASIEVRDGAQRVVRTLPVEAPVRGLAELSPDRWAVFVDREGALWGTDGERVERLAAEPHFTHLDAAGGVGWAIGADTVARLSIGGDGRPRVEDGLLSRDGVDVRALGTGPAQTPTAIRARACGRAQLALREFPFRGDGAVSMWWIEPLGDGLALRAYEGFDPMGETRAVGIEWIDGISGPERAPLLLFSGNPSSSGVQAPEAALASVPFPRFTAFAYADGDVLVAGPHARMALLRLR